MLNKARNPEENIYGFHSLCLKLMNKLNLKTGVDPETKMTLAACKKTRKLKKVDTLMETNSFETCCAALMICCLVRD